MQGSSGVAGVESPRLPYVRLYRDILADQRTVSMSLAARGLFFCLLTALDDDGYYRPQDGFTVERSLACDLCMMGDSTPFEVVTKLLHEVLSSGAARMEQLDEGPCIFVPRFRDRQYGDAHQQSRLSREALHMRPSAARVVAREDRQRSAAGRPRAAEEPARPALVAHKGPEEPAPRGTTSPAERVVGYGHVAQPSTVPPVAGGTPAQRHILARASDSRTLGFQKKDREQKGRPASVSEVSGTTETPRVREATDGHCANPDGAVDGTTHGVPTERVAQVAEPDARHTFDGTTSLAHGREHEASIPPTQETGPAGRRGKHQLSMEPAFAASPSWSVRGSSIPGPGGELPAVPPAPSLDDPRFQEKAVERADALRARMSAVGLRAGGRFDASIPSDPRYRIAFAMWLADYSGEYDCDVVEHFDWLAESVARQQLVEYRGPQALQAFCGRLTPESDLPMTGLRTALRMAAEWAECQQRIALRAKAKPVVVGALPAGAPLVSQAELAQRAREMRDEMKKMGQLRRAV